MTQALDMPIATSSVTIVRDAVEILAKLIAFDTTSFGSNLALIGYVETYLASYGIQSRRIVNADGSKANLIATIGPAVDGGVILSGHTDVVPVAGQAWSSDPFELVRRDGKLFGRGTSDMKSFLALALAAVPHLVSTTLARPVHLAFSYDEEVGCLGAPDLIRELVDGGVRPSAAIIGEPTSMQIVNSHKSIHLYEVIVTGREAHSSLVHEGISANMVAIDILTVLAGIARAEQRDYRNPRFEPPWSTLTVGTIQGGTAANILARECRFTFDLRSIPERAVADILQPFWSEIDRVREMLSCEPGAIGISVEHLASVPALHPEIDGEAERLSVLLTGVNHPGGAVSYGAEAGQFQAAGFSTVICGPGSISQAHRADEYIEIDQIEAGAQFIARLIEHVRAA